jgi:hypothetical protein
MRFAMSPSPVLATARAPAVRAPATWRARRASHRPRRAVPLPARASAPGVIVAAAAAARAAAITVATLLATAPPPLPVLGRARVWRFDAVAAMWSKYDDISLFILFAAGVALLLAVATAPHE